MRKPADIAKAALISGLTAASAAQSAPTDTLTPEGVEHVALVNIYNACQTAVMEKAMLDIMLSDEQDPGAIYASWEAAAENGVCEDKINMSADQLRSDNDRIAGAYGSLDAFDNAARNSLEDVRAYMAALNSDPAPSLTAHLSEAQKDSVRRLNTEFQTCLVKGYAKITDEAVAETQRQWNETKTPYMPEHIARWHLETDVEFGCISRQKFGFDPRVMEKAVREISLTPSSL